MSFLVSLSNILRQVAIFTPESDDISLKEKFLEEFYEIRDPVSEPHLFFTLCFARKDRLQEFAFLTWLHKNHPDKCVTLSEQFTNSIDFLCEGVIQDYTFMTHLVHKMKRPLLPLERHVLATYHKIVDYISSPQEIVKV